MRPRPGELVAALGGAVLFVSLFLHWYAVDLAIRPAHPAGVLSTFTGTLPQQTGWQAFTVTDILLAAYALLAIAVLIVAVTARGPAKPIGFEVVASALGGFAVLLVAYRILNQPGPNSIVEVRTGAWIGLAATAVAWGGSWLAMRDESTPGAVVPELPLRPAPPA